MTAHAAAPQADPLGGHWGGEQARLVFEGAVARIELGCASGTIAGPVRPDSEGRFVASGTFEQHQGGPQRAEKVAAVAKARYTGELKDGVLTLSIWQEGLSSPQVIHMRQDAHVKLVRCY